MPKMFAKYICSFVLNTVISFDGLGIIVALCLVHLTIAAGKSIRMEDRHNHSKDQQTTVKLGDHFE